MPKKQFAPFLFILLPEMYVEFERVREGQNAYTQGQWYGFSVKPLRFSASF